MSNHNEPKKEPSLEQLARYAAWDVKNINKSIERMADALDKLITSIRMRSNDSKDELPF